MSEILLAAGAVGIMGILFGIGLAWSAKIFHVVEDERTASIRAALPGANCGACGFPGCDGLAAAIAAGKAGVRACPVGGEELAAQLSEILGVKIEEAERNVARVRCNGSKNVSREKYAYHGIEDCFAASHVFAGHKSCQYGCLGNGTCLRACPFDAIEIINGVSVICQEKCRSCGLCVEACPKKLIELVPVSKQFTVLCRSKDKGGATKQKCDVGCIGCTKCVRICPVQAIEMTGAPLAQIDPAKCTNCGECEKVCPTGAIKRV
jgi:RnfABCDGE-type electron transport complex B subunit